MNARRVRNALLWSPARLRLAAGGAAAVMVAAWLLLGWALPQLAGQPTTATAETDTRPASGIVGGEVPLFRSGSAPAPSGTAAVLDAADAFTRAWLDVPASHNRRRWLRGVEPTVDPQALPYFQAADLDAIPRARIRTMRVLTADDMTARVRVDLTRGYALDVALGTTDMRWLVTSALPALAPVMS